MGQLKRLAAEEVPPLSEQSPKRRKRYGVGGGLGRHSLGREFVVGAVSPKIEPLGNDPCGVRYGDL